MGTTRTKSFTTEEIEGQLLAAGVQPTLQRIAIYRHILCEADHPTADQVFDWASRKMEKISQATVYNTLGILVQSGLLSALRLPHSEKVIYDTNLDDHHHFLDEATGRLYDLPSDQVEVQCRLPRKFKARHVEVVVKGRVDG